MDVLVRIAIGVKMGSIEIVGGALGAIVRGSFS